MLLYDQNLSQTAVASAAAVVEFIHIYIEYTYTWKKNLKEITKLNYVYFYKINKNKFNMKINSQKMIKKNQIKCIKEKQQLCKDA